MSPSKRPKGGNKRYSYISEISPNKHVSPNKHGENAKKSMQKKRKLSNMLGPQWSKQELERFYEAYRKYGKDWKKVATTVRNRSPEMVEALYSMNRAYLSLPEGTASVVGLIAMMTDHYCVLGGSETESESNEQRESRVPQKRARRKFQNHAYKESDDHFQSLAQSHSASPSNGCLPLLKKRRTGIVSHAVRKRTPRVPISHPNKDFSPAAKQNPELNMDASDDDDVAHEIAMVLTEASQRSGSPHVSRMANMKPEAAISSSLQEGHCKLSLGATGANNRDYNGEKSSSMGREGASNVEFQVKQKNHHVKTLKDEDGACDHLDNIKEAYTGKEKQKLTPKSLSKGSRKRSRKSLFGRDEDSPFDALQTLADLSLMMPSTISATKESTAKGKEEKTRGDSHESHTGMKKRKQKSFLMKNERASEEAKSSVFTGKRSSHNSAHIQGKLEKTSDHTSSSNNSKKEVNDSASLTTEVPSEDQLSLPTEARTLWRTFIRKDTNSSVKVLDAQPNIAIPLLRKRELNPKENLSNCLSRYQARRWCAFEWFYSAIDYPWFAKSEFVEYLNHVGLGHIPRLTRVEWGVIKGSLGKPRRFSEHFLKEEKEKLNQYRESVRTHYAELRAGTREGLPTDLAGPLSVGQRVVAIHPRTREMHNGTVLTVDHSRYHVQFDQPNLGVEYVMDIECMPLNPMENVPASFRKQNLKINERLKEEKTDESIKVAFSESQNNTDTYYLFPSSDDVEEFLKCKEKIASEPPTISHNRAKEADVQAVAELTRALDKKEAVVFELKRMNEEIFEKQKDGDNLLKDSEAFKKPYAAVLLQLNEVNEQVSSALFRLRERNTYQGISLLTSSKPEASSNDLDGRSSSLGSYYNAQDCGSHVAETVESSRVKAQKVVSAALQAISSFEKMGKNLERIEEAIDFVSNRLLEEDFSKPADKKFPFKDSVKAPSEQSTSLGTSPTPDPKLNQNEQKIPSELIAHCVAALLMIQKCTERHFPPAEVAQVLDSALTSLQPLCSQNLSLYEEIQKFMGIIRTQILALIPI